ncbi:MAG: thiamine phosphate synthase [Alphaproteobacteria bacterium]|nr:thiamine phosphate synthase [Alphaproteobacteria bacterium]
MPTQLYLITPPRFELASFTKVLEQVLSAVPVACLQLRLKPVDEDVIFNYGQKIKPITNKYNVALIINDRADLAKKLQADGVHIGQEDIDYQKARQILGPDRIIGVTCHNSKELAYEAADAGADYVAFGAFFPSQTKEKPKTQANISLIHDWHISTNTPCVAIGGITPENCQPLIEAGADFLAVSGGVWQHPDGPVNAARKFEFLFKQLPAME